MVKQITKMADKTEEKIVLIPAEKLKPNKIIRADIESRTFEYNLDLLENSIKSQGILTPLLVTESGDDYLIVDGNRRYVAGTRAKIKEFPCIIKKEINDEVKDSELVVLYHAEKRRRIIDRENTQNYKPNRWEFRIYVINKKAIKSYEQQDRTFNIKLKTLTIGI